MTFNVLALRRPMDELVQIIEEADPDVLMVQELIPSIAQAIDEAHGDRLTFSRLRTDAGWGAQGIWSRYPIVGEERWDGSRRNAQWQHAVLDVNGRQVHLVNLHLTTPTVRWRSPEALPVPVIVGPGQRGPPAGGGLARPRLRQLAAGPNPVLVAGDLNLTDQTPEFRRLLDAGYDNAYRQAGWGIDLTFPALPRARLMGRTYLVRFPVVGIDHMLVSSELQAGGPWCGRSRGAPTTSRWWRTWCCALRSSRIAPRGPRRRRRPRMPLRGVYRVARGARVLLHPLRERRVPAPVDRFGGGAQGAHLGRVGGLDPGVDQDRGPVGQVVARASCPAGYRSAPGAKRVKVDHRKRSLDPATVRSSARTSSGQPAKAGAAPAPAPPPAAPRTAAPAAPGSRRSRPGPGHTGGQLLPWGQAELPGQVAPGRPQTEEDALAAPVEGRPGVVQGVHRRVVEDEQVALEVGPGQDVLQGALEVPQIAGGVRDQEELGQRELPFAQDAEGRDEGPPWRSAPAPRQRRGNGSRSPRSSRCPALRA